MAKARILGGSFQAAVRADLKSQETWFEAVEGLGIGNGSIQSISVSRCKSFCCNFGGIFLLADDRNLPGISSPRFTRPTLQKVTARDLEGNAVTSTFTGNAGYRKPAKTNVYLKHGRLVPL